MDPDYHVKIIKREFSMTSDDYHATVTRLSDGIELVFIAPWKWYLKWMVRPKAIRKAFKHFDEYRTSFAKAMEEYVV